MTPVEPVLTEAVFLFNRKATKRAHFLSCWNAASCGLEIEDQLPDLRTLMRPYQDRPMSFADACLVRLAELYPGGMIFALDTDFRIYRRHGNKVIAVLMSEG